MNAVLGEADLVTHARNSITQVFVIALNIVKKYLLVLKSVFQGLQIGLLLILRLHHLWVGI